MSCRLIRALNMDGLRIESWKLISSYEFKVQGNSLSLKISRHCCFLRWPIPVKQIQVNENTSQKTETTPRKRKQLPENKNKFNLTKTTPRKRKQFNLTKTNSSKPKQLQVNENRFTLRNSSCGRVVDIFCLVIHRQTCSFSPIGLLTRDIVGSADHCADTLTS